jgi:hypothetical protein
VNLSGATVRTENVLVLASMLDEDGLSAKLERAVTNENLIVALTQADRERIVALLALHAPPGLAELRDVLAVQLKRHKDLERQQEQTRLNQVRSQRHREPP